MERNSSKRGARGFTFRELATATTNFKVTNLIGEGGFGRVYKGRLETNQIVAIKKLDRNGIQGNQEFIVEVLMLSLLHHSNLVRLIGYCADGDQRILVYEYMPMGSLEDHLFVASNTLWPEFEIISEDECVFDTDESEENISSSLVSKDQMDESVKSLMDTFEGDGDKKAWASFEERISKAPEQVLRYSQDEKAKPLWPMSSGRPSKADILKCNYCNGPLCYELQILPQLLYYFGVKNDADSLDWATIVVYTCADSCETSMAYNEEFAWVQLSPSVALPS